MESIWMTVEEEAPFHNQQTNPFFYGIFTEEPAKVAMMLQRPITPFQPLHEEQSFGTDEFSHEVGSQDRKLETFYPSQLMPMSPPSNITFGYDQSETNNMFGCNTYVSLF